MAAARRGSVVGPAPAPEVGLAPEAGPAPAGGPAPSVGAGATSRGTPWQPRRFTPAGHAVLSGPGAEATVWRHASGSRHLHLATDTDNFGFTLLLRTPPPDDSGVIHALEHLVGCGSQRYPARNAFYAMLSRSAATFLNGLSLPGITAYTFTTRSPADYRNLLRVVLDGVFFPLLRDETFAEEVHRLQRRTPGDASSPVVRRGVVLSEMKGDQDTTESVVERLIGRGLYPGTALAHNHGGDPAHIPALTPEQTRAYHRRFYVPRNCWFITTGALDIDEVNRLSEESALSRFPDAQPDLPGDRPAPATVDVVVDVAGGPDAADRAPRSFVAWRTAACDDPDRIAARFAAELALAGPAGGATHAAGAGGVAVPGTGVYSYLPHLVVVLRRPDDLPRPADLVGEVAERVARRVDPADTERAWRRVRLELLDSADHTAPGLPYQLRHALRLAGTLLYGGDPLQALPTQRLWRRLEQLRADPGFAAEQVDRWLSTNGAMSRLTIKHRPEIVAEREAAERSAIAREVAVAGTGPSAPGGRRDARATSGVTGTGPSAPGGPRDARATSGVTGGELPCLDPADLPPPIPYRITHVDDRSGLTVTTARAGGDGLAHAELRIDIRELPAELQPVVPVVARLAATGHTGDAVRGGARVPVTAVTSAGVDAGSEPFTGACWVDMVFGAATLADAVADLMGLFTDVLRRPEAGEHGVRAVARALCAWQPDRLGPAALTEVSGLARAAVSQTAHRLDSLTGVRGRARLRALLGTPGYEILPAVREVLDACRSAPARLVLACGQPPVLDPSRIVALAAGLTGGRPAAAAADPRAAGAAGRSATAAADPRAAGADSTDGEANVAIALPVPVAFVAHARRVPVRTRNEAAALAVLAQLLRIAILHEEVRERGGAYGVATGFDLEHGCLTLGSFRDPSPDTTLRVFDECLAVLSRTAWHDEQLVHAKLAAANRLAARGPAGAAVARLVGRHGTDGGWPLEARDVTAVGPQDVRAAVERCLLGSRVGRAVLADTRAVRACAHALGAPFTIVDDNAQTGAEPDRGC